MKTITNSDLLTAAADLGVKCDGIFFTVEPVVQRLTHWEDLSEVFNWAADKLGKLADERADEQECLVAQVKSAVEELNDDLVSGYFPNIKYSLGVLYRLSNEADALPAVRAAKLRELANEALGLEDAE